MIQRVFYFLQCRLEVTGSHDTIRKIAYNFLFIFQCNYGHIWYRFGDKARYRSKIAIFSYPFYVTTPHTMFCVDFFITEFDLWSAGENSFCKKFCFPGIRTFPEHIPPDLPPPGQFSLPFYMVQSISALPLPPSANLQYKAIDLPLSCTN